MRRGEDLWPLVHAERAALADDLAGLSEEDWATPSLCDGLTVREVLAHLTAGASLNGLRWFAGVVRCRFDFDAQVAMRLAEQMGDSGADTLARFRAVVSSTTSPPLPRIAMLGEAVVHGEDIRRPLGIAADRPVGTLTRVAEYYRGSDQVVVARSRVADLRLEAADGSFAAGEGPRVAGSTLALIMAMTGRSAHLGDLSGDGVEVLRGRLDG
ncbi:maleylpyruvate isomerase family mycothiol-dependent enzyme [Nocardiopsis changdeensis]|uniref:Maleylpyruvate isomerase family mycothiol-dependent enzyme n=1 Tax=Nocardiopsis changdeensis TaxID=2831969 RepID=A0ABX8BX37_9ACTN|nr:MULTISPECIES: maleylpyruvate isomerase family mycothiol-dependent enzyme [Nocardiopsis]QUX25363.1 maleylpyruvate isomerase family mycothiol-dependent enzyme [Nocardiopsis changdeensis]QYX35750.1 maleylpyruvate isomerase family mycothiol-dependent enzyme [Nocardiopsis sp. MT53]